ncbi:MAG TPA: hypothetical protein QF683_20310 [SAR324 cluster bacterium]|nr:hypothetical protein [SAR324 cluster bacterium]
MLLAGVAGLGFEPLLGIRLGGEKHPLALAIDFAVNTPSIFTSDFMLLNLHRYTKYSDKRKSVNR